MSRSRRSSRRKSRKQRSPKAGLPPGTIVVDECAAKPVIDIMAYGPNDLCEKNLKNAEEIAPLIGKYPVIWVNVSGLGDAATISRIGALFGLHKLSLEDIAHLSQRVKVDRYESYFFIVARLMHMNQDLTSEQISLFFGDGFVLTFQEVEGDSFDPVRDRLRQNRGVIREQSSDYLAYALLDTLVDHYFPILELYEDRLEELEDLIMTSFDHRMTERIHNIKRDLWTFQRNVYPLKEVVHSMIRLEDPLISETTRIHMRDIYDHSLQIIDLISTHREIASGLVDLNLSAVNYRMNEIMKVLTIIATIFIPLSFIAGVYGMNFNPEKSPFNMPELNWAFGYPFALGMMGAIAIGFLFYFRKKGWLGGAKEKERRSEQKEIGSDKN